MALAGRFAVWLISFGRWRSEALSGEEGRIYAAAGAFSFVRGGRRVITTTGQVFASVGLCGLLAGFGVLYYVVAV